MFETATPQEIWILFFATAALTGLTLEGGGRLIWKFIDRGRSWIIWWDEDAGLVEPERRKIRKDHVSIGKGKKESIYFLNGKTRKQSTRGHVFVIDKVSGASLAAPPQVQMPSIVEAQLRQHPELALETRLIQEEAQTNGMVQLVQRRETKEEALQRSVAQFMVCDPMFTRNKLKTNSFRKWHSTQEGEEDWRVKVAPLALVAVVIMSGAIVWLISKQGG